MKEQKRKSKVTKIKEAGITLVALVVTIIVLLILAGVTITLALSNNGVIGRAQYSSNIWANATRDEETAMEQFASDVDTLTEGYINREGGSGGGSGEGPVVSQGVLGEPINYGKYGSEVTNYTANGMKWRLFFEDTNNIYLISETPSGGYPDHMPVCNFEEPWGPYTSKGNYLNGADISSEGKALMPLLGGANSSSAGSVTIGSNASGTNFFRADNTSANVLGTAYLCDTSASGPWSAYKTGSASWAMGAPTAELYVASYNATHKGGNQIVLGIDEIGYTENTGENWLNKNDNNGIYSLTGTGNWWLAGIRESESRLIMVNETDGWLGDDGVYHDYSVRPVVCLPKTSFQYTLAS